MCECYRNRAISLRDLLGSLVLNSATLLKDLFETDTKEFTN